MISSQLHRHVQMHYAKKEIRVVRRLHKYLRFLLLCFEKFHYLELRECILYEENECKEFLFYNSLIKQVNFKNIHNTAIDEYGFLSLKDKIANTSFSKKKQMTLLIVCILAFKKEMHFKDLINEAIERSKLTFVYFQNMPTDDQLIFFKKFPSYFTVSEDSFFVLPPTITIPTCIFEDLSTSVENTKQIDYFQNMSTDDQLMFLKQFPSLFIVSDDGFVKLLPTFTLPKCSFFNLSSTFEDIKQVSHTEKQNECKGKVTMHNNIVRETPSSDSLLPDNFWPCLIYSAYFLKKIFELTTVTEHVLAASLIGLHLVNYFNNLSFSSQTAFVREYFSLINKELKNCYVPPVSENKEIILCISYLLLNQKVLHYEKIVKELKQFNFNNAVCRGKAKEQFKYFKMQNKYFNIQSNGYVTLQSTTKPFIAAIYSIVSCNDEIKRHSFNQSSSSPATCKLPSKSDVMLTSSFDGTSKCFLSDKPLTKSGNCSQASQIDLDTKNAIIDICFHALSACEKMSIEKLCSQLKSCNIEKIENFFTFCSFAEKLAFFQNISQYFNVSRDGFVSLRSDAVETYMPKTNLTVSELFDNYSEKSWNSSQSISESVKSNHFSDCSGSLSVSSTNSSPQKVKKPRHCGDKKQNYSKSLSKPENTTKDTLMVKSRYFSKNSPSKSRSISHISSNTINSDSFSNRINSNSVSDIFLQSSGSDFATNNSKHLQNESSMNPSTSLEMIQKSATSNNDLYQVKDANVICEAVDKTVPENFSEAERCKNISISKDANNCENCRSPLTSMHDSGAIFSVSERAVNFFCVIFLNFGRYTDGFSESFLKNHLRLASSEVKSFLYENYKNDFISFFQDNREVFYVSKQSNLVYMLQN